MNQKQIEYIKKHNAKIAENELMKIGLEENDDIIECEWCVKNGVSVPEDKVEASHTVCDDEVCFDCWSEVYE